MAAWKASYRRCGSDKPVVTEKSCGCGKTKPPHFVRLSDFVPKLETALRKRVCKQGTKTDQVAEILRRASIDADATTSNIGSSWCTRENVLSGKGKVASMLPPGVVFGWVDREGGAAGGGNGGSGAVPAADSTAVDTTVRSQHPPPHFPRLAPQLVSPPPPPLVRTCVCFPCCCYLWERGSCTETPMSSYSPPFSLSFAAQVGGATTAAAAAETGAAADSGSADSRTAGGQEEGSEVRPATSPLPADHPPLPFLPLPTGM